MKRLHIHMGVDNLTPNIKFYSTLFGAAPDKVKSDYAKWKIDEPALNFAISTHADEKGLNHLGIQVNDENELEVIRSRINEAEIPMYDEGFTECCYARSQKSWIKDPQGIAWENFRTMEQLAPDATKTTSSDNVTESNIGSDETDIVNKGVEKMLQYELLLAMQLLYGENTVLEVVAIALSTRQIAIAIALLMILSVPLANNRKTCRMTHTIQTLSCGYGAKIHPNEQSIQD